MSDSDPNLLEAYQRFHETGPEWGGHGLSNHGPMAVEAMVRRGYADSVGRWVDNYTQRLVEPPRGLAVVTEDDWREALGDIRRVADWTAFFHRELAEHPWREVVTRWWPRLLPGIAGGATHGVIRVGHVVHALVLAEAETGPGAEPAGAIDDNPLLVELIDSLGYWAACWKPVHGDPSHRPGSLSAAEALAAVPPVADQVRGVPHRIAQLPDTELWQPALGGLRAVDDPGEVPTLLTQVIDATVVDYLPHGHGQPVMRVHASTAPAAVLRVLPALPRELWVPSMDVAWQAAAALRAACLPPAAGPADLAPHLKGVTTPEDAMDRAIEHGDEHVIKFVDIAMDTFARTGDPDALAASSRCVELVTHVETAGRSKFDGRGSAK